MRRRTYLATGVSLCLAGCTSSRVSDEDSNGGTSSDGNGGDTEPTTEPASDEPDGDVRPAAAGTDDDFGDLDVWTVVGGKLSPDEEHALVGPQSARLEVAPNRGSARLSKSFPEPRDLTDVVPGVAVAADGLVAPRIRLVDGDGDMATYRRRIAGDMPLMRYNFGVEAIEPGFDAAAVREVHILTRPGDEQRSIRFDDLHFTPRPETGKILIQFDDGNVTDYTEALPLLEEYGYPATTFVNTDTVGNPGRLSVDQLRELRDAGWCVGNHTAGHARLSDHDRAGQETQIRDGKEWLRERGFEDGAEYFAYPYGDYDATSIELVADYHAVGFAGGYPVQGYTTNPRLASRIGEPDADRVREVLELTAELRGITGVLYHSLDGADLEAFETMVETIHHYESRGDLEVIVPWDLEERFLF